MMEQDNFDVPILFLIFNRPDTTFKVFQQIRECKPSRLYIAADGPRSGFPRDKEECRRVRQIATQVDWDCQVRTLFRDDNLGCRRAVSSGIDWLFRTEEIGIILEDDTLPHATFFRFCQELLEYYKEDKRIMMISGDNFQLRGARAKYSYYFTKYPFIWGWATWRRAWNYYDVDMKLWPENKAKGFLFEMLADKKEAVYWENIFNEVYGRKKDAWSYQWLFACWLQSALSISPGVNLISNIGFGKKGTHTRIKEDVANLKSEAMFFPLVHPPCLLRDVAADRADDKAMFSRKSIFKKILNRVGLLDRFRKTDEMVTVDTVQNSKECPSCGHNDARIYNLQLSVWRCLICGLLFKDVSVNDSYNINKNAWADLDNHRDETGATNLRLSRIYLRKLILSLGKKNIAGLKILDFGTGRGDMLTALSELGADVYGVEPFGYEYLSGKGFKIFPDIEEIPKGLIFDGIIVNDVIEHIFCPKDVIKKLFGLLNAHGWLYIATPNAGSLNAKVSGANWREFYNPGHIRFFDAAYIEGVFIELGITRYKQLYWFVEYSRNPLKNLVHYFLRIFRQDGVLRYILPQGE